MKKITNHYNESIYSGIQPIRVLQHNTIHWLEATNSTFGKLSRILIAEDKLKSGIEYEISEEPIFSEDKDNIPRIESGRIILHETFLSYLWCIAYAITTTAGSYKNL